MADRSEHVADEVGRGPLSRGSAALYRVLVLEVLLLVTISPTLVAVFLLERDASNVPLYALALLPVGPAVVAGLGAVRAWELEPDLAPARGFWRCYRSEALATLRWWVPTLVVLAVLGVNLVNIDLVAGAALLRPVTILLVLLVLVWAAHMLVLQARFTFRMRDAARIAVAEIVPQWRFSLGIVALLVVLGGVTLWTFDAVTALLAWAAVLLLHVMARPLVADVTERFTTDA